MNISLSLPEASASYIRHARKAALLENHDEIRPGALDPIPFAMYLLAHEPGRANQPLGMLEFTLYDQIYQSFEASPYPSSFGLEHFGPFESFGGTRTIYVEPAARLRVPPLYLLLAMAGCELGLRLGAEFSTASADVNNKYLMNLYHKTGGEQVGVLKAPEQSSLEIAVFVFDLKRIVRHPAMRYLKDRVQIDPAIVETIRRRNRWQAAEEGCSNRHGSVVCQEQPITKARVGSA